MSCATISLIFFQSDESEGDTGSDEDDSIDLVFSLKTGRPDLLKQHRRVRHVAKAAIDQVLGQICLKNAFPEGPDKFDTFIRRILVQTAEKAGDKELVKKLKSDIDYAHSLAHIVSICYFMLRQLLSHLLV